MRSWLRISFFSWGRGSTGIRSLGGTWGIGIVWESENCLKNGKCREKRKWRKLENMLMSEERKVEVVKLYIRSDSQGHRNLLSLIMSSTSSSRQLASCLTSAGERMQKWGRILDVEEFSSGLEESFWNLDDNRGMNLILQRVNFMIARLSDKIQWHVKCH